MTVPFSGFRRTCAPRAARWHDRSIPHDVHQRIGEHVGYFSCRFRSLAVCVRSISFAVYADVLATRLNFWNMFRIGIMRKDMTPCASRWLVVR